MRALKTLIKRGPKESIRGITHIPNLTFLEMRRKLRMKMQKKKNEN